MGRLRVVWWWFLQGVLSGRGDDAQAYPLVHHVVEPVGRVAGGASDGTTVSQHGLRVCHVCAKLAPWT